MKSGARGRNMGLIKRKLKLKIWERAGWLCHYCGCKLIDPLDCHPGHFRKATVDHVIPRARGGGTNGNLVASCQYCNEQKGSAHAVSCYSEPVRNPLDLEGLRHVL